MLSTLSASIFEPVAFPSFQQAFDHLLQALADEGSDVDPVSDKTSSGSRFGTQVRSTRELLSCQFALEDICHRLIHRAEKPVNLSYAVASFLWLMTGADDPEMICFYNEHGRSFMEGGKFCCAFGARIRRTEEGDQLEYAIRCLADDTPTRRATISVFSHRDLISSPRDTPCLLALHYFIRSGALLCIATMRSQSAAMIMPYDVFVLTMLQEYLALRLDVRTGRYVHCANSLHYYFDEQPVVEEILGHHARVTPKPMPRMPREFINELKLLMSIEIVMRSRISAKPTDSILDLFDGLSEYSAGLLSILAAGARRATGTSTQPDDPPLPPWCEEMC